MSIKTQRPLTNSSIRYYGIMLARYLKPLWPGAVLLVILVFAGVGLQIANPLIIRYFIDTLVSKEEVRQLLRLALAFLGASLCLQITGVAATYLGEDVGWNVTNKLRADVTRHCLRLDMTFHNTHTPGEMLERIDGDINNVARFFSQLVVRILGNLLLLVGVFIVIAYQDWRVSLTLIITTVLGLVGLSYLRRIAVPYWKSARQANADLFGFLEKQLSGTEDIRSNNTTPYVMQGLLPGLVSREFFNRLTENTQAGLNLETLIAFLIVGAILQMGSAFGSIRLNVLFTYYIQALFHKNMLGGLLQRPGACAVNESPGETISRFKADAQELPRTAIRLSDLFARGLLVSFALVILVKINLMVALTAVIPLSIILIVAQMAGKRIEKYRKDNRETSSRVMGFLSEIFSSVQDIKVANSENKIIEHFSKLNEIRRKAALKDRLFTEVLSSIFRHSVNLGIGIVLLISPSLLKSGGLTIGDLTLFVYYLDLVTRFISYVGSFWPQYKQTGVSVNRMAHILKETQPETLTRPGDVYLDGRLPDNPFIPRAAGDNLESLEITDLTFQYPDSDNGIKEVNLNLKRGSFVVITGRVGSGKTTLLRVLLGLLPNDTGEIRWNGKIVEDRAMFFVPPRCAYTPQVPHLFSTTIRKNRENKKERLIFSEETPRGSSL